MFLGKPRVFKKSNGLCAFLFASAVVDQVAHADLATFEKFVNGDVPVKEAIVFRELSKTNGAVLNKEWWRFAYQNDSWFFQQLSPNTTNTSKLVPTDSSVCGSSFSQFWLVTDKNLFVVDKSVASGSLPDTSVAPYRSRMFNTLSLGLPRIATVLSISDAMVEWNRLDFKTRVGIKFDPLGNVLTNAVILGTMTLDGNDMPLSAQYRGIGQFPTGIVTYKYTSVNTELPTVFMVNFAGNVLRYQFLSLKLGINEQVKANGYGPSLFADMRTKRTVIAFTNDLGYEQRDGKSYPAFRLPIVKIGDRAPELRGTAWFNTDPLGLDRLRGKVVLLEFWNLNCPPCIEGLPHVNALFEKFKKQGLIVIGICTDWGTANKVGALLRHRNVNFPNMMDRNFAIADYQTGFTTWAYVADRGNPSYVLIDKSGKIAWESDEGNLPSDSQIKTFLGWPQRTN